MGVTGVAQTGRTLTPLSGPTPFLVAGNDCSALLALKPRVGKLIANLGSP